MRNQSLCITFILFWMNIVFIGAVRKDICDKCVRISDCPAFAKMNSRQQQAWLQQFPCKGPSDSERPSIFGFSPVAKGDYVCCPNSNIWGIDNGYQNQHQKPVPIRPNERGHRNYQSPDFNNPGAFTGQQNNLPGNPDFENGMGVDTKIPHPFGKHPGTFGGDFNGNPQNGQNNQGIFDNMPNLNLPQFPNNGNNFGGQPQNGQYPNGQFPNNNQFLNSNFPNSQFPNGQYPSYQFPSSQSPNSHFPNNQFPNDQFPSFSGQTQYPNSGEQNSGIFNQGGYQQCPSHTNMIPDPSAGCCGKDDSDSVRITDLQKVLSMYAPDNSNRYPRPNYSPRQKPQRYPYYQNRQKRSFDQNNTSDDSLEDRIAGGKETELDQFPWTALLKVTFDYGNREAAFSCGGSLISQRFILTAGHCVYESGAKVSSVEITLAEYDKRTFPKDCISEMGGRRECIENIRMYSENIIHHPEYDDDQLHNDIALIKIRGYAPYTRFIRPICLPPLNIDDPDLSNLPLSVAGWGRNGAYETNIKQSTVVHLVPHDKCLKSYPQLTSSHLCAAGRTGEDTCKGDSGGPLMMLYRGNYYIIGVVSGKRADSPCGTSVPSLYTNVYQYVPWITSSLRN
ncbi:prophenoloxidase activating proteinase-2 [Danaus plexippus plexippus]|uniref:Prophenoloxidase activating proteinase-2 n=1 Tax=Danaus plexippus plexippus TaxID=278856 RepID=A0A212EQ17_DANPL|nr:prophenoloxidase activating proteinase-2 [Danaus plexippus plexippus]